MLTSALEGVDTDMINVFPVPASSTATLSNLPEQISSIVVFDLLCQQIGGYEVNGSSFKLDISALESGIYIIQFVTPQGIVASRKLLVE